MTHIAIGRTKDGRAVSLPLRRANRHGLITGATGTGKTVTLQTMIEQFSAAGVPVFAADIKGDLSGVAASGSAGDRLALKRATEGRSAASYPVSLLDLFGLDGAPVRGTVQEIGPQLLSRMFGLNAVQEGVMAIALKLAGEEDTPLMDLQDLQAMMGDVLDRAADLRSSTGNVTPASIGAIQRAIVSMEAQGGDSFFGERTFEVTDLIRHDSAGRGVISLLSADRLMESPRLYAGFLLWLLTCLFQALPEVGDLVKPKLVFFFDEAHLLFADAPKPVIEIVERLVRLIRSKGVGVYFVTQNPLDVPQTVLAQLGTRVQHALRAFTPRDQKAVRSAAETFRQNPGIDTAKTITQLAVGEALVSVLQDDGTPSEVEIVNVLAPTAQVGPISHQQRRAIIDACPMSEKYGQVMDRDQSYIAFYERLSRNSTAKAA